MTEIRLTNASVLFDLTAADLVLFDRYEAAVLALLPDHGATLEMRVRAVDASAETHLLRFPSQARFDAFIADPRRLSMARTWSASGAKAQRWEVSQMAD